jgi:tRNA 2-thiouridine synthesizing protein E
MDIELNGRTYAADERGYLLRPQDWNEELARHIAELENVTLTPQHWEVVNFVRAYYVEFQIAPAIRVLAKAIAKKLGPEKGNSTYLYELFPKGPAMQACRIAGLPKPTGCV